MLLIHVSAHTLKWNKISACYYSAYKDNKSISNKLNKLHKQRIKNSVEFNYLISKNIHKKEVKQKTSISLNQTKRVKQRKKTEKKYLNFENLRRKAKGLKQFKTYKAFTESLKKSDSDKDADIFLNESQNILIDYIKITH